MPQSIRNLLREARQALGPAGAEARLEAEILLGHALSRERSFLHARPEFEPEADAIARFAALIERRRVGEPVAYILGEREFWSLPLKVNRDTLIPRPETELLVEQALARIPLDAAWYIADLGTGSGAIALALARERPGCRIVASDVAAGALAAARANAAALDIGNIEFCDGNWFEPLAGKRFNMIVSNPPYIAAGDVHLDQADVAFEPRAALVGGADGMDAITAIAAGAPEHLEPGGHLLLEHGYNQAAVVAATLAKAGFVDVRCYRDLCGHGRVSAASLPATGA
ncbi:MAG TPA: peptide chain release factor N(5)-glutamine methyltransferase [Burkholderiales bacterium]|nr:peptide chain release factor N(5)-glutamine methyltransferase [Burkholderiales bacterium]